MGKPPTVFSLPIQVKGGAKGEADWNIAPLSPRPSGRPVPRRTPLSGCGGNPQSIGNKTGKLYRL